LNIFCSNCGLCSAIYTAKPMLERMRMTSYIASSLLLV
jgi:hypothetical protein